MEVPEGPRWVSYPSPLCCVSWHCLLSVVLAGATSFRGSQSGEAHSESPLQPSDKCGSSLLLPIFVCCSVVFETSFQLRKHALTEQGVQGWAPVTAILLVGAFSSS